MSCYTGKTRQESIDSALSTAPMYPSGVQLPEPAVGEYITMCEENVRSGVLMRSRALCLLLRCLYLFPVYLYYIISL